MPINQRVAQRKTLRHPHHSVIHRLVAMRMQLTQNITNDRCRFTWFGSWIKPQLIHGVKNTTLYRLLTVADIWKCTAFDDRDRVIEISALGKRGKRERFTTIVGGGFE